MNDVSDPETAAGPPDLRHDERNAGRPIEARPPWTSGLVMVCRDCDGYSKKLRRNLKEALDGVGARKRVRVVACGCLDVCPKRAAVVVTAGSGPTRCTIVRDVRGAALHTLVSRFEHDKG